MQSTSLSCLRVPSELPCGLTQEAQRENSARRCAKKEIEQNEGYCILSELTIYALTVHTLTELGAEMITDTVLTALDY
jgi:hypothetical protein